MGKVIFLIILLIMFHFACGFAAIGCIYDSFYEDGNPLWKIPLLLLGPISFIVFMCVAIYQAIRSYIKEVKNYYKRKLERKRIEKRDRMRKM